MGSKEFEARVAAAFGESPPPHKEIEFKPMDIKRYIALSNKQKKEG